MSSIKKALNEKPNSAKIDAPILPGKLEAALKAGDFDAIEKAWQQHYGQLPTDTEFFDNVARAVHKVDADTAEVLLSSLDDNLKRDGHDRARLEMLRRHGRLLHSKPQALHNEALAIVRRLNADKPSLEPLIERVGLSRAVDDVPKNWAKIEKLESLLAFDRGAVVAMEGKGVGRVEEVNLALESFKVIFEGKLELRVGFNGAPKMLRALAPGHFLRRKLEDPASLKRLAAEDPSELLREVLVAEGRAMAGADVKKALTGVVTEAQWNSFWTAARKHPQVLVDSGKKTYTWAESSAHAQGSVWDSFVIADPQTQIALLRREGERDAELKRRMAERLGEVALVCYKTEPGLACEIYYNLERVGHLPPPPQPFSPDALLVEIKDLRPLFAGIKDRGLRERTYQLARERRRDWADLLGQALWQETEAKALDTMADLLANGGEGQFDAFFEQLMSQPRKSPAGFTWLVERIADRTDWLRRNPLRTMKQLFWAMTHEDFLPFRAARLVPLSDSGGTLPRLLAHLEIEQAEAALETLQKTAAILDYQRLPLITALQLRFPKLREEKVGPLYATAEKIEEKKAELKRIAEEEIPTNRKAIESARELGDLRENFEYHAARKRHEYLSALAGKLNEDLRRCRPIDFSQVKDVEVVIGARVKLLSGAYEKVFSILGPWESDPDNDIVSNESDLALKLLGMKLGDKAALFGGEWEIAAITPHREAAQDAST